MNRYFRDRLDYDIDFPASINIILQKEKDSQKPTGS